MRRFDAVIQYAVPDKAVAIQVLKNRLSLVNTRNVNWTTVQRASNGLSHAEIARACETAVKNAIIAHRSHVETSEIVQALKERRPVDE